jgi:transglutaminase-like putative cysteine protease
MGCMERKVTAALTGTVLETSEMAFAVSVSDDAERVHEELRITVDGADVRPTEVAAPGGSRLHLCRDVPPGALSLFYAATVTGRSDPIEVTDLDVATYVRPSRYCESDRLAQVSFEEFGTLRGRELVDAVRDWVSKRLQYLSGSSRFTDGAVETYLARQGVCRDFAHLVIALLRARGVPARIAAVYAPGLTPMDFHAVAEVALDGVWEVVDATQRAPRSALLRLATGRDAADTAFLTTHHGQVRFGSVSVTAHAAPELPADDHRSPLCLG